jgi:hypothetical protein
MRRATLFMVMLLMASGITSRAFAQAERQVFITHEMNSQDLDTAELQAFDQLTNANPTMARRLAANPHLANSEGFLKRWPELNNFFAKYPGSKGRFLDDPGNYLADVNMHSGHMMGARQNRESAADADNNSEVAPAETVPPAPEAPSAPPAPAPALPKLPASPASPPNVH